MSLTSEFQKNIFNNLIYSHAPLLTYKSCTEENKSFQQDSKSCLSLFLKKRKIPKVCVISVCRSKPSQSPLPSVPWCFRTGQAYNQLAVLPT